MKLLSSTLASFPALKSHSPPPLRPGNEAKVIDIKCSGVDNYTHLFKTREQLNLISIHTQIGGNNTMV